MQAIIIQANNYPFQITTIYLVFSHPHPVFLENHTRKQTDYEPIAVHLILWPQFLLQLLVPGRTLELLRYREYELLLYAVEDQQQPQLPLLRADDVQKTPEQRKLLGYLRHLLEASLVDCSVPVPPISASSLPKPDVVVFPSGNLQPVGQIEVFVTD